jgi:hypothetical protein
LAIGSAAMRERYSDWALWEKVLLWFVVATLVLPVVLFFLQRAIGVSAEPAALVLALL